MGRKESNQTKTKPRQHNFVFPSVTSLFIIIIIYWVRGSTEKCFQTKLSFESSTSWFSFTHVSYHINCLSSLQRCLLVYTADYTDMGKLFLTHAY